MSLTFIWLYVWSDVLAKLKYGKARNKSFLALLLIETWNYILIKCKKEGRKLCALGRIEHCRSLIKAFAESQFVYYTIICILCIICMIVL